MIPVISNQTNQYGHILPRARKGIWRQETLSDATSTSAVTFAGRGKGTYLIRASGRPRKKIGVSLALSPVSDRTWRRAGSVLGKDWKRAGGSEVRSHEKEYLSSQFTSPKNGSSHRAFPFTQSHTPHPGQTSHNLLSFLIHLLHSRPNTATPTWHPRLPILLFAVRRRSQTPYPGKECDHQEDLHHPRRPPPPILSRRHTSSRTFEAHAQTK
jgi:hypothetical protein